MTYETGEYPTGNFCSPSHSGISVHLKYLIYFRTGFSCSHRLRMLQKTSLLILKTRGQHMGDVPYTYKDAKRYSMNFSMDQSAHQAKSVHFLQPLPRNYLLLKLLRALNLLSHALLEFPSYMNISDDCSYFWSTTLANS